MAAPARAHLLNETPESLSDWLAARGQPAFRARQVFEWVYRHGAERFEAMSNLPRGLRDDLAAAFDLYASRIVGRQDSRDGTVKVLLAWPDGATTESVLIPDGRRRTACISSQDGCPVGCTFCASGLEGVTRNLTAGEIVEQVLRLGQVARERAEDPPLDTREQNNLALNKGAHKKTSPHVTPSENASQPVSDTSAPRLSNVVFMGSGEPLANYARVLAAVRTLNAPWGPNIGARKITVSTVGLPKQIRMLADEGLQMNLALSLHAPADALRRELIPWAERIDLDELLDACRHYFRRTGREITLEYVLLAGVNDRSVHAEQLARLARGLRCNVNLIRYHPVAGLPFGRPLARDTLGFQSQLRRHGINAHVRRSRGMDIDAACGQLRRVAAAEPPLTHAGPAGVIPLVQAHPVETDAARATEAAGP